MAKNHQIVYAFIAYDDIELLERKIKFLYTREDLFIVHWNAYSSKKKLQQLQEIFKDYANVHIYSKIKVVWGMYTILLAMLENMKLALEMAPNFDHLIMLSEQCVPVKTKEYIKTHLAQYKGRSFLPSHCVIPRIDTSKLPYETNVGVLVGHFCPMIVRRNLPFFLRWQMYIKTVFDFLHYFIPIMKDRKRTWQKMKKASSFRDLTEAKGMKKVLLFMKYILLFPLRFILVSLDRGDCVGMYGSISKLYFYCAKGRLCVTKNAGPAGCYCREDVEYLCQKENLELAQSMKPYHAPEEYFCQTILYNSPTQKKNFLNETFCATDYLPGGKEGILRYLEPNEFLDEPLDLSTHQLFTMPPGTWIKTFKYQHVCFLRKVSDHQIYEALESYLLNSEK